MCRILFYDNVGHTQDVRFVNRDKQILSLASDPEGGIDFCTFHPDHPDVIDNVVDGKDGNNAELFLHALAAHLGFTVSKI